MAEPRELPPVGDYNLTLFPVFKSQMGIDCQSDSSPITMSLWGQKRLSVGESGEPITEQDASYLLSWPSGDISEVGAVQAIRAVGEQEPYPTYESSVYPEVNLMKVLAGDEEELEKLTASFLTKDNHTTGESNDLYQALVPSFNEISVSSPSIFFSWSRYQMLPGSEPHFTLIPGDEATSTPADAKELITDTIAPKHLGGVALAMDNLEEIFQQYRHIPPESLLE